MHWDYRELIPVGQKALQTISLGGGREYVLTGFGKRFLCQKADSDLDGRMVCYAYYEIVHNGVK